MTRDHKQKFLVAGCAFTLAFAVSFGITSCGDDPDTDGVGGVTITETTNARGQHCTVAKSAEGVSIDCEDDDR